MDRFGCYGNLATNNVASNNVTPSSMWSNGHHRYHSSLKSQETGLDWSNHRQHGQIHEEIFPQEATTPMFSPPNRPYYNMLPDSMSPLMPDFGIDVVSTKTPSLDSLDCLLSATSSINTDTSVEDDGISVVLPSPPQASPPPCFGITKKPNSTSKRTRDQTSRVPSFGGGESPKNPKKPRLERGPNSSNISFQQPGSSSVSSDELDSEAIQQMKEMIYRAAAFRPVILGAEIVEKPKRKNVKISSDPQTVAARQRRERISERIRALQRLVPGGNKMDTASMLDEAANYLKFLRSQVKALESFSNGLNNYKFDHQNLINFNHHLMALGSFNNYSLFPMQNLFSHQATPSPIHRMKD